MNENQNLGFTPEQIKERIIKAISENQQMNVYVSSLVQRLFEELGKPREVLRYRVALMLNHEHYYFRLATEHDDVGSPEFDPEFTRWVSDWMEVEV
mgnify:CR=1 FL=1